MRTLIRNNKAVATVAGGALVVMTAGAAYAYWTTTGAGTGSATANGQTVPLVVNHTALTGLVPVNTAQEATAVTVTVNNPADFSQSGGAVTASVKDVISTDPAKPCAASNFTYVPAGTAPVVGTLDARATSGSLSVGSLRLVNSTTANQDNCKGAVVNLTFAVAQGS